MDNPLVVALALAPAPRPACRRCASTSAASTAPRARPPAASSSTRTSPRPIAWARAQGAPRVALVGYSFGALMSMKAMAAGLRPAAFIGIGVPTGVVSEDAMRVGEVARALALGAPSWLISGADDPLCDAHGLRAWVAAHPRAHVELLPGEGPCLFLRRHAHAGPALRRSPTRGARVIAPQHRDDPRSPRCGSRPTCAVRPPSRSSSPAVASSASSNSCSRAARSRSAARSTASFSRRAGARAGVVTASGGNHGVGVALRRRAPRRARRRLCARARARRRPSGASSETRRPLSAHGRGLGRRLGRRRGSTRRDAARSRCTRSRTRR